MESKVVVKKLPESDPSDFFLEEDDVILKRFEEITLKDNTPIIQPIMPIPEFKEVEILPQLAVCCPTKDKILLENVKILLLTNESKVYYAMLKRLNFVHLSGFGKSVYQTEQNPIVVGSLFENVLCALWKMTNDTNSALARMPQCTLIIHLGVGWGTNPTTQGYGDVIITRQIVYDIGIDLKRIRREKKLSFQPNFGGRKPQVFVAPLLCSENWPNNKDDIHSLSQKFDIDGGYKMNGNMKHNLDRVAIMTICDFGRNDKSHVTVDYASLMVADFVKYLFSNKKRVDRILKNSL